MGDSVSTFHTQTWKWIFLKIHYILCIAFDLSLSPGTEKHPENLSLGVKEGAVTNVAVLPTSSGGWLIEMLFILYLLSAIELLQLSKVILNIHINPGKKSPNSQKDSKKTTNLLKSKNKLLYHWVAKV